MCPKCAQRQECPGTGCMGPVSMVAGQRVTPRVMVEPKSLNLRGLCCGSGLARALCTLRVTGEPSTGLWAKAASQQGRGAHSGTHRSLCPGRLESQCLWVCSCSGRSLARVAIESWVLSEATVGGCEAGLLVTASLPFKIAWFLENLTFDLALGTPHACLLI